MPVLFPLPSPAAGHESPSRRSRRSTRAVSVVPTLLASHREVGGRMTRWTGAIVLMLLAAGLNGLRWWHRHRWDGEDVMDFLPPVPKPGFGKLSPAEADAMRKESEQRRKRAATLRSDSARIATRDEEPLVRFDSDRKRLQPPTRMR